jgi:hypothetical protein
VLPKHVLIRNIAIALVLRAIHGADVAALGEERDGVEQKGGGGEKYVRATAERDVRTGVERLGDEMVIN